MTADEHSAPVTKSQAPLFERLLGAHRLERLRSSAGQHTDELFPFRYEYNEFVQLLGGTTYIVERDDVARPDTALHSESVAAAIERGVHELLSCVAPEGWRPACPTDAASLWLKGFVEHTSRRCDLLGRRRELTLVSVNVPCERVIWEP